MMLVSAVDLPLVASSCHVVCTYRERDPVSSSERDAIGAVIVPAWNEALTIRRNLACLLHGLDERVLVIVACNGCTDDTEDVVRSFQNGVEILSLPAAGKARAIRAAEDIAPMPRVYLDADAELSGATANVLLAALRDGAVAARPPVRFDVGHSDLLVRSYYRTKTRLPSVASDLCGAGVYSLGTVGRDRFGSFPEVTADDLFVARIVAPHELVVVDADPVVVRVPRTTRALVRTLARVQRGNHELQHSHPTVTASTTSRTIGELVVLMRRPRRWPDVVVYTLVTIAARVRARVSTSRWERDESGRGREGVLR